MAEMGVFNNTTISIVGKTQGAWHCDAKLGSGAFGIIHIWSNIKDDLVEKITTKHSVEMPPILRMSSVVQLINWYFVLWCVHQDRRDENRF